MRRIALLTIAAGLLVSFWVAPARALGFQSFVSGSGDDSGLCTRLAPCGSIAGALANTYAGGEIECVDSPGVMGFLIITKSVTVDCTGVAASVQHTGVGITIDVPASDTFQLVHLRGVNINGLGLRETAAGLRERRGDGSEAQRVAVARAVMSRTDPDARGRI